MSHNLAILPERLRANRNFLLLWCAYGVSAMGDHLSEMAILKTQHAHDLAVDITPINARMTFMFFLPFFLLAPFAGLLADRLPRRGIMIFADLIRAGIMFAFAGLLAWTADWGALGRFTPLMLVGALAAVFSPARSAMLPTLIRPEQLARANGMISGLGIIATMASTLLGGYLAKQYQPTLAFTIDAFTFLVSGACLYFLSPPREPSHAGAVRSARSPWTDLRNGFRYVRSHRHVLELLAIAALVWFCGPLMNSVIPAVVRDVYHGDYQTMGGYRALLGLGFVLGATIVSVLGDALRHEIAITWGLIGVSVGTAVFAFSALVEWSPGLLAKIGGVGVVISGTFAVAVMAGFNALLQRTTADRFRGRVFGICDLGCMGALLIATGLLGLPAWARLDRWVGFILAGVALATFTAGLITLRVRLRRGPFPPILNLWEHLNEFVAKFWWRMQRVGRCTVPRVGPAILTSNHRCTADPLFLCASVPYRPLSFLVAKEYTEWPIFGYFCRAVECIPVTRSGQDTGALKQAIRYLRAGKVVGVFIEGGIVAPGETPELRDGIAMLALRTGAKVIPAHVSGVVFRNSVVRGLLTRHCARVRFGRPVDLHNLPEDTGGKEDIREATRRIYAAIQALAPPDDVFTGDVPDPRRRSRRRGRQGDDQTP